MKPRIRIGLDLTPARITAVRVLTGERPVLEGAAVIRREHTEDVLNEHDVERIISALARSGCDGAELVVSAPVAHTLCASLELPKGVSCDDATRIAKMELARGSRVPPESIECGWWDVPPPARASDARHALAIGLSHAHAEQVVDPFERIGLQISAIETRPCAIARALRTCASGGALVADIGDEHTLLFLIHEGTVLYSRVLTEVSLRHLNRKIKERCGLDERASELLLGDHAHTVMNAPGVRACVTQMYEYLSTEVQRSIAYTAHRYSTLGVNSIALTGPGASLVGLRGRLASDGVACVMPCVAELSALTASTYDLAPRADLVCALGLATHDARRQRGAA